MSYRKVRIDSNAAQFARAGNPWDGDGTLRPKGAGKREPQVRVVKRVPVTVRRESEALFQFQCRRDLARKLQAESGKSRVMAPLIILPETGAVTFIQPVQRGEAKPLTSAQRALRERQRADFAAKAEAGQLAYEASHNSAAAEKRALKARIEKLRERLAAM